MPLSEQEWRKASKPNAADRIALAAMQAGLPPFWADTFSILEIVNAAPVVAMHYDRKRMAEAMRDRVLHRVPDKDEQRVRATLPAELRDAYDFLVGRFEATLFTIADQMESGTIGMER